LTALLTNNLETFLSHTVARNINLSFR